MQTAIEHYGLPIGIDTDLLDGIRTWMDRLGNRDVRNRPELDQYGDGHLWSCHALARVVKVKFDLQDWIVRDGFFGVSAHHSWLQYQPSSYTSRRFVLDVLPMATLGGPLLINIDAAAWSKLYRAMPDFLRAERLSRVNDEVDELMRAG